MRFKKFLLMVALPVLPLAISAQSIDVNILENVEVSNCQSNSYCVDLQLSIADGADQVPGNSSVRFSYDPTVLKFEGRTGQVNIGTYESKNFDQNTTCGAFNPYVEHSFDGLLHGDFLISMLLLNGAMATDCNKISSAKTTLSTICFEVLDQNKDPKFVVAGSQNGSPINTAGTNFNNDSNNPTQKLNNGTFGATNKSFKNICETSEVSGINTVGTNWALVNLQPVPVKDVLLVELESNTADDVEIQVFSLTGKLISSQATTVTEGVNTLRVDANELPAGAYFVSITKGDETLADKFIKR